MYICIYTYIGLSAWTIQQAIDDPFPSSSLTLTGIEWERYMHIYIHMSICMYIYTYILMILFHPPLSR
jgi:hypothetical protein